MNAIFVINMLLQGYGPMLMAAEPVATCAPQGTYCNVDEQCCSRTCVPIPRGAFGKCD